MMFFSVADLKTVLKRFKADVHNAMKLVQEPHAFSASMRQIYSKHVNSVCNNSILGLFSSKLFFYFKDSTSELETEGSEVDVHQEYSRQRQFLERSISSLKAKVGLAAPLLLDVMAHRWPADGKV